MASGPPTCDICGAIIKETEEREAETLTRPSGPVLIHQRCRGRKPRSTPPYAPEGDALDAYKALDDPSEIEADQWVRRAIVDSQRRMDDTDYDAGLDELIERGWAESKDDRSAFRLTPKGRYLRDRALPKSGNAAESDSNT